MGLEIEVFAEADRGDHAFDRVGEGDPHDQAVVEEVVVQIEGHVEQVKAVFEVFGKISARERDLDGGTDPGPLRAHVDVDLPLRPLGLPGFSRGSLPVPSAPSFPEGSSDVWASTPVPSEASSCARSVCPCSPKRAREEMRMMGINAPGFIHAPHPISRLITNNSSLTDLALKHPVHVHVVDQDDRHEEAHAEEHKEEGLSRRGS
jgi:hypothetical protein